MSFAAPSRTRHSIEQVPASHITSFHVTVESADPSVSQRDGAEPERLGPSFAESCLELAIEHEVERHVVLLRGQRGERQRLLRIAMIAGRIHAVGYEVTDHAVLHAFLIALGQILKDDHANGLQRLAPIFRQFREILFDGCGFALHGRIMPWRCLGTGPRKNTWRYDQNIVCALTERQRDSLSI